MANKRMFTMHIVDSDAFLDMPASTQNLYFHLNMRADDDGFIGNPKRIQRTIGASDDDLKLLIAKRFVLAFDDGVIVIKHWRMHNTIRADRYTPTTYQEELGRLLLAKNNAYTLNSGNQLATSRQPDVIPSGTADIGLDIDIDLELDIDKGLDITKGEKKTKTVKSLVDNYTTNAELAKALVDFIDHRKQLKKPMTIRALELILLKLDKLASDDCTKVAIINQSILKGWQDVFELKEGGSGKNSNRTQVAGTAEPGSAYGTYI